MAYSLHFCATQSRLEIRASHKREDFGPKVSITESVPSASDQLPALEYACAQLCNRSQKHSIYPTLFERIQITLNFTHIPTSTSLQITCTNSDIRLGHTRRLSSPASSPGYRNYGQFQTRTFWPTRASIPTSSCASSKWLSLLVL
jgi:hypothetical protein